MLDGRGGKLLSGLLGGQGGILLGELVGGRGEIDPRCLIKLHGT